MLSCRRSYRKVLCVVTNATHQTQSIFIPLVHFTQNQHIHSSSSVRSFSTQSTTTTTTAPNYFPGRRVVVTGLGMVSPLGYDVHQVYSRILQGESAITTISDPNILATEIPVKVSAPITDFNPVDWVPRNALMVTSRFESFAIAAATLAIKDANWTPITLEHSLRAGVAIGSGIGCVEEISSAGQTLANRGSRKLSAYTLPKMLANLAAGQVSILHRLHGPNHCVSTACATGAHAIGDAYRFIKYGDADMMVAGGTESGVSPLSMALFSRIHALSRETNPEIASQPFGANRDGFIMGEGAGVVVLEELNSALDRGAHIYGEVVGYGLSSDAHHVTSPPEGGFGAMLCMKNAIQSAGITPKDIGYINCHATSTSLGDNAELSAIRQLFLQKSPYPPSDATLEEVFDWVAKDIENEQQIRESQKETISTGKNTHNNNEDGWSSNKYGPLLSSTKGATGHALGAAGSIESIFAIKALTTGIVPPTIGINDTILANADDKAAADTQKAIDPRFYDLRIVTEDMKQDSPLRQLQGLYSMSNSFGFGGSNTSLIFKKY